jgi:putative transposase
VLRLPYLALTSVVAFIRLLPMSDVDKNVEILALRHLWGVNMVSLGLTRVDAGAPG